MSVMGRPLGLSEMRRFILAERIRNIVVEQANLDIPWATWVEAEPEKAEIWAFSMLTAKELGYELNG